jgi:hypothetical protein
MPFGPPPLSVGNASHMQSVMAVSTPKGGGERRVRLSVSICNATRGPSAERRHNGRSRRADAIRRVGKGTPGGLEKRPAFVR